MSQRTDRLYRIRSGAPGVTSPQQLPDRLDPELMTQVKETAEQIVGDMLDRATINAMQKGADASDEDLRMAMTGAENAPGQMGTAMFLLGVAYGQTKVAEESADLAALLDGTD